MKIRLAADEHISSKSTGASLASFDECRPATEHISLRFSSSSSTSSVNGLFLPNASFHLYCLLHERTIDYRAKFSLRIGR